MIKLVKNGYHRKEADTVQALERLLEDAKRGRLTGAVFAAKYNTWARGVWVIGEYVSSAEDARSAGQMLREVFDDSYASKKGVQQQSAMLYKLISYPDGSAKMPYCTGAVERIFRLTVDQVAENARLIDAVIHPEDLPKLIVYSEPFYKHGGMWDQEYRTLFPDGTITSLIGRAYVRVMDDGTTVFEGVIVEKE